MFLRLKIQGAEVKGDVALKGVEGMIVEAEFHFYRVMPTGQAQQFYTVEIKQARVVSIKQTSPDRLVPATANLPPIEEVSFAFASMKWTHAQGGSHEDSMSATR